MLVLIIIVIVGLILLGAISDISEKSRFKEETRKKLEEKEAYENDWRRCGVERYFYYKGFLPLSSRYANCPVCGMVHYNDGDCDRCKMRYKKDMTSGIVPEGVLYHGQFFFSDWYIVRAIGSEYKSGKRTHEEAQEMQQSFINDINQREKRKIQQRIDDLNEARDTSYRNDYLF